MNLILGSAQLGTSYGVLQNKFDLTQLKELEKLIYKEKIKFIDTSSNYKNTEKIIGNSKLNELKIITKIKLPKKIDLKKINDWTKKKILSSLKKLKKKKIYALLIHDHKDLLGKKGELFLKTLINIKNSGLITKLGVSLYDVKEIKIICKFFIPDLIQVPFNILDTRILDKNLLNFIKIRKIQIHVRSIFLQGLLLNDHSNINIIKKLKTKINRFKKWCNLNQVSYLSACINFVKNYKFIDFCVIGFNNYNDLRESINTFKGKKILIPNRFSTNQKKLIDPRYWS